MVSLALHPQIELMVSCKTLRTLLRVWKKIPNEWKLQCKAPPPDQIKVAKWKLDPITVPEVVLTQLTLWDNDPLSILALEAIPSPSPVQDFPSRLYHALEDIHEESPLTAIRSRILLIALHLLMCRLGVRKFHTRAEAGVEFLLRLNAGDLKTTKNIKRWTTEGKKYYSLANDLGGLGSIVCMPVDITAKK
jgi:hypothetical protein